MSQTTVILCEGSHDQAVLTSLAEVTAGWHRIAAKDVPDKLHGINPKTKLNRHGEDVYQPPPSCLSNKDDFLLIRSLEGIDRILGTVTLPLLESIPYDALGIVVDANEVGVDRRLQSFRKHFTSLNEQVKHLAPGKVIDGSPRIGLWIAPNNQDDGSMDDLLIQWIEQDRRKLVSTGKRFIESLKKLESESFTKHQSKAILGAIHQCVKLGASLAVSLWESKCWLNTDVQTCQPLHALQKFIEELSSQSNV